MKAYEVCRTSLEEGCEEAQKVGKVGRYEKWDESSGCWSRSGAGARIPNDMIDEKFQILGMAVVI